MHCCDTRRPPQALRAAKTGNCDREIGMAISERAGGHRLGDGQPASAGTLPGRAHAGESASGSRQKISAMTL